MPPSPDGWSRPLIQRALQLAPRPLSCAYCWDRGFVVASEPGADPTIEWVTPCNCAGLTLHEVADAAAAAGLTVGWAQPDAGCVPLPHIVRPGYPYRV